MANKLNYCYTAFYIKMICFGTKLSNSLGNFKNGRYKSVAFAIENTP